MFSHKACVTPSNLSNLRHLKYYRAKSACPHFERTNDQIFKSCSNIRPKIDYLTRNKVVKKAISNFYQSNTFMKNSFQRLEMYAWAKAILKCFSRKS